MESYHRELREALIQAARKKPGLINYSDPAVLAMTHLDMDKSADREKLVELLDEIARFEHSEGRPLLTAVVVNKYTLRPGKGFFELAVELGLMKAKDDRDIFYVNELDRVYHQWR